jgi:hypothetical protein
MWLHNRCSVALHCVSLAGVTWLATIDTSATGILVLCNVKFLGDVELVCSRAATAYYTSWCEREHGADGIVRAEAHTH